MATRIYFTAWGRGNFEAPAYAMTGEERDCERVAQAIARKSGAEVCGQVRPDGYSRSGGLQPESGGGVYCAQFTCTIGTPVRGGGWSPVAEVSFKIHRAIYLDDEEQEEGE